MSCSRLELCFGCFGSFGFEVVTEGQRREGVGSGGEGPVEVFAGMNWIEVRRKKKED